MAFKSFTSNKCSQPSQQTASVYLNYLRGLINPEHTIKLSDWGMPWVRKCCFQPWQGPRKIISGAIKDLFREAGSPSFSWLLDMYFFNFKNARGCLEPSEEASEQPLLFPEVFFLQPLPRAASFPPALEPSGAPGCHNKMWKKKIFLTPERFSTDRSV